jgi:hypothetical protein
MPFLQPGRGSVSARGTLEAPHCRRGEEHTDPAALRPSASGRKMKPSRPEPSGPRMLRVAPSGGSWPCARTVGRSWPAKNSTFRGGVDNERALQRRHNRCLTRHRSHQIGPARRPGRAPPRGSRRCISHANRPRVSGPRRSAIDRRQRPRHAAAPGPPCSPEQQGCLPGRRARKGRRNGAVAAAGQMQPRAGVCSGRCQWTRAALSLELGACQDRPGIGGDCCLAETIARCRAPERLSDESVSSSVSYAGAGWRV